MTYLLDANVWVALLRRSSPRVAARFQALIALIPSLPNMDGVSCEELIFSRTSLMPQVSWR